MITYFLYFIVLLDWSKSDNFFLIRVGLRDLSDRSNRNVTKWWNTEYSYPNDLSSGVIATMHDYLVSTDMVHFAIERNKKVAAELKSSLLRFPSIVVVWFTYIILENIFDLKCEMIDIPQFVPLKAYHYNWISFYIATCLAY